MGPESCEEGDGLRAGSGDWPFLGGGPPLLPPIRGGFCIPPPPGGRGPSDAGAGAGSGPRGVSPPFRLRQAEVKPEPRLGAGLAPAWTGLACVSTPLSPHPGPLLEE